MPWGTTCYTSRTTPTSYRFIGQRLESSIGLYYYGARWYDPATGRFIQPDTIVPGGAQGLDRYAYVGNHPLRYTDPSGHDKASTDCGPDGMFCDSRGKLLSNSKIYDVLVEEAIMTMPDTSAIYESAYNSPSRVEGVLYNYNKARKALFTKYGYGVIGKYMDYSGKLNDDIWVMIAVGEFASESGDAYVESIEALSNQYFGETKRDPGPMRCRGESSLERQLFWATQMQAWYSPGFANQYIATGSWMTQLGAPNMAINGYQYGADNSWFWGDVSEGDKAKYIVTASVYHPQNEPTPFYIVYEDKIYVNR